VPEPTALQRAPNLNSTVSKVSGCRVRVDKVRFSLEAGIIIFGTTSMYLLINVRERRNATLSVSTERSVLQGAQSRYTQLRGKTVYNTCRKNNKNIRDIIIKGSRFQVFYKIANGASLLGDKAAGY
jgi:hypothetical protein